MRWNKVGDGSEVLQTLKSTSYCFRSKDQGSPSPKSVPCPDLHDDERADSDEELPPAFSSFQDSKRE